MKYLAVLISVILMITAGSLTVSAAGSTVDMTLEAQQQVKPGKSFNVNVSLRDNSGLGAVRFKLYYNNRLTLKNAAIENKNTNEFLKYNDAGAYVYVIYAVKNVRTAESSIRFRFEQDTEEETDFSFRTEFIDAVNAGKSACNCSSGGEVIVSAISELSETAQPDDRASGSSRSSERSRSSSEKQSSSKTSRSRSGSSSSSSGSKKTSSTAQDKGIESLSQSSAKQTSENTPVHKFDYEKYNDELSDNSMLYYTIGIIIILVVVIIAAASFARKLRKNHPD